METHTGSAGQIRHQCLIYRSSPAEHLPDLAGLIVRKIQEGRRVVYLNSPAMVDALRSYLTADGMDMGGEIQRGALVLSSSDGHLVNGAFNTDRMISLVEGALVQALRDGFKGLWAAGDISWEFGPEKNYEKLHEYEVRVEVMLRAHPELEGVCLYHQDTLPPHVVQEASAIHRAFYINQTLSRTNPHYGTGIESATARGIPNT